MRHVNPCSPNPPPVNHDPDCTPTPQPSCNDNPTPTADSLVSHHAGSGPLVDLGDLRADVALDVGGSVDLGHADTYGSDLLAINLGHGYDASGSELLDISVGDCGDVLDAGVSLNAMVDLGGHDILHIG